MLHWATKTFFSGQYTKALFKRVFISTATYPKLSNKVSNIHPSGIRHIMPTLLTVLSGFQPPMQANVRCKVIYNVCN